MVFLIFAVHKEISFVSEKFLHLRVTN